MNDKLPININDLLTRRTIEDERIEFKESWNPEAILHTLCAFANDFHNLGGGYVIVGVAEKEGIPQLPPKGLQPEQIDKIHKELLQLEKHDIVPAFHTLTATYEIQGKLILVLWAVGGEMRPYRAKKSLSGKNSDNWAYYIRQHSNTVEAKGEIEQELLSLANKIPFDDRLCISATLEDLEPHLMREFLTEIRSELAPSAKTLSVEELAKRMNVVGGVIQEKIFKGPIGRITQDALQYIKNLYLQEKIIKVPNQAKAIRLWNYPFLAIEEAVVNAVYHRSYEIREPIEVRITPTEIEILSYPGPDRSIKLADLQTGKAVSRRYRNRRLGEFLKDLELTEGRSTGIPKIIREMAKNGSPEAVFDTDEERSYFLISLPIHQEMLVEEQDTPQDTDLVTDLDTDLDVSLDMYTMSVLVERLIKQLSDTEKGISQLMQELNIHHKRHFRTAYLLPAIEQGLVEMTIPDKPTSRNQKYRLTVLGKERSNF